MAVAEGEAQATIKKKVSLGNGTYRYYGTLAFGKKYPTGGYTLGSVSGDRYKLPAFIDYIAASGAYSVELSSGKLKLYGSNKTEKAALLEVANETDLSAITALPFVCDGA